MKYLDEDRKECEQVDEGASVGKLCCHDEKGQMEWCQLQQSWQKEAQHLSASEWLSYSKMEIDSTK
jgi:hypothetical protein